MAELAVVRVPQGLIPATPADSEIIERWKLGDVVRGKFTKMRNPRFHRKFFAMLDLAWEYWEPTGGLIPRQELRGIWGLARYFERQNNRPGQLTNAVTAYIAHLQEERAGRFPAVEKSREAFRSWVIVEAGHYELAHTPNGIVRRPKSIRWDRMDDTEFVPLYRDVFGVCWRLVLSGHFESEEDAMAAADMLGAFA